LLGYLRAALFPFLLAGVLFLGWCGLVIHHFLTAPRGEGPYPGAQAAVAVVYLCVIGFPPLLAFGAVVGSIRVLWRAAGASAFIPIVLIPIGVVLATFVALPLLGAEVAVLAKAYAHSFRERGTPITDALLDGGGGGGAHGGGVFALIVFIIALPGLLLDLAGAAISLPVLLSTFLLVASLAGVVFIGAFVLGLPSLWLAGRAFLRRTRSRWEAMQSEFDAKAAVLPTAEEGRKAAGG
jgi:hypothetical protein